MTDVETIRALTGYVREKDVQLPVSGVALKQEIPNASALIAAQAFLKKHTEDDLAMCAYIMKHHVITPSFKDMLDTELDDLVGDMHYKDIATIILAFFSDIDLNKEQDREKLEQVFRELGKDNHLSDSPESLEFP